MGLLGLYTLCSTLVFVAQPRVHTASLRCTTACVTMQDAQQGTSPPPPPPRGSKPLKGTRVPKKLAEWGMDEELWNKIDNKRNLIKMMNRGEENFARPRIIKLRQIIAEEERQLQKQSASTSDASSNTVGEPIVPAQQGQDSLVPELDSQSAATTQAEEGNATEEPMHTDDDEGAGASGHEGYLQVVCPAGLGLDRRMLVQLEDGRAFEVTVPDGVTDGDPFLVGPFQ